MLDDIKNKVTHITIGYPDTKIENKNSATVTLIKTPNEYLGITCFHVLEDLIKKRNAFAQVGRSLCYRPFQPGNQDKLLDIIIFSIKEDEINEIGNHVEFFNIFCPPVDEQKCFVIGFPKEARKDTIELDKIKSNFGYYMLPGKITGVGQDNIYIEINKKTLCGKNTKGDVPAEKIHNLGGISGGPVVNEAGGLIGIFTNQIETIESLEPCQQTKDILSAQATRVDIFLSKTG